MGRGTTPVSERKVTTRRLELTCGRRRNDQVSPVTGTVVDAHGNRAEGVSIFTGSAHFHSAVEHVGLFPVEKREELSQDENGYVCDRCLS
jgi:hypothetical protein